MKKLNLISFLIVFAASCSVFSGPSNPQIIVELEELPVENSLVFCPRWSPDGSSIYFYCWNVWEPTICVTDIEGDKVERVLTDGTMYDPFELSSSGDKVAYWATWNYNNSACDKIVIADLENNITDSLLITFNSTTGRFSKNSDTLFYVSVPYEGIRRYNLNSDTYEVVVSSYNIQPVYQFDLFPGDTAVVLADTIFSLTSNTKSPLSPVDGTYLGCCSVNQQEPRYIAVSDMGNAMMPDTMEYNLHVDEIWIVDIVDKSYTSIKATPRDSKKVEYWGVCFAEFSPDGNSIAYSIFRRSNYDGFELAIVNDVLE